MCWRELDSLRRSQRTAFSGSKSKRVQVLYLCVRFCDALGNGAVVQLSMKPYKIHHRFINVCYTVAIKQIGCKSERRLLLKVSGSKCLKKEVTFQYWAKCSKCFLTLHELKNKQTKQSSNTCAKRVHVENEAQSHSCVCLPLSLSPHLHVLVSVLSGVWAQAVTPER